MVEFQPGTRQAPGRNSNPSGEISLSYMDTHDGLLYSSPYCACELFISSPELAQGELLGYRDVRRTCGRP